MGRYYSTKTLPYPFAVVWCLYPLNEDKGKPGPIARPCLVWQSSVLEDENGQEYGSLVVSYGGDAYDAQPTDNSLDLIISDRPTYQALNLSKPTRFSVNPNDRPEFIWGDEYFVPPQYKVGTKIVLGYLTDDIIERLKGCLRARGLPVREPQE